MTRRGFFHSYQGQNLQQVILHHVPNDAELVEVAAPALSSERLLEGDLHRGYVVPVPRRIEHSVPKSQSHQVLHHLFAEIMIDTIDLFFSEQRRQMIRKFL